MNVGQTMTEAFPRPSDKKPDPNTEWLAVCHICGFEERTNDMDSATDILLDHAQSAHSYAGKRKIIRWSPEDRAVKLRFDTRLHEPLEQSSEEFDPVNHPKHYDKNGVECIDWIEMCLTPEEFRGYLKGNSLKYLWRNEHKGHPVQDLGKARWYVDKLRAFSDPDTPDGKPA